MTRNAKAIVLGSPENSFVSHEFGEDQPVWAGDCGRWWEGTMGDAAWRIDDTTVVVVMAEDGILVTCGSNSVTDENPASPSL